MVALDLTRARSATASLMVDACTITRDAQGTDDDTFDQTAGTLTPPNPDTTTVYTGACLVRPAANTPRDVTEGGVAILAALYEAVIPHTAAVAKPGDVFTVTASGWDPALVGRVFRVREAMVTTVNIRRSLLLEART